MMPRLRIALVALFVLALPLSAQTDRSRRAEAERAQARRSLEQRLAELHARLGNQSLTAEQTQELRDLEQQMADRQQEIAETFARRYQDQLGDLHLRSDELALDLENQLRRAHELDVVNQAAMQDRMRAEQEALRHFDAQDIRVRQNEALARAREQLEVAGARNGARDEAEFRRSLERLMGSGPRPADAAQDPADSIYRAARELLNRRDYAQAARLFGRLREDSRYARSAYRADAYYWQAFALSSEGNEDALFQAQDILGQLVRQYPADKRHKDTNGLMTTVQVRLAQLGVPNAARQIREMALDPVVVSEAITATAARSAAIAAQSAAIADMSDRVAWAVQSGGSWTVRQRSQCQNDDSEIRLIALNALVRMDTAAAMPVLRDVLARRDECAAALRQSSLITVSRIKTDEAENLLVEAARNDPEADVRRTALMHLATRNPDRAVALAGESLRSAQDATGQEWALQTLARMRTDAAWRIIRDYAAQSTNSVESRRRAIAALGQSNDSTNTAFLRDLYGRVGDERQLKEAILMSSAFRRTGMPPDWLFAVAQNDSEDSRLREYAISALGRRRDVGVERFVALYDRATDKRVRSATLVVLSDRARNDSAATDKLIAIARNETDPDLRKRAVMGLAASNDPRARELLIEILRK
jgi:TolA-binding protein